MTRLWIFASANRAAGAGQRLVTERRGLDLAVLDGIAGHVVTVGSGGRCGGGRSRSGGDRVRRALA